MITVDEMNAADLALYISKIPTNSACARASIERLNKLLARKQEEENAVKNSDHPTL